MSMTHDEKIEVIQADKEGRPLQSRKCDHYCEVACRHISETEWEEIKKGPAQFNFGHNDYRIKPSPPKPREWWIIKAPGIGVEIYHDKVLATQEAERYMQAEVIHVREIIK